MCLAIVAPKNTDKNSEFLFNAIIAGSKTNRDGMGFAFKRASTKKVYISKGYEDVQALIDVIKSKKLGDNDELLVHARIGNKGKVNAQMCHPFVCADTNEGVLQNDKYVDDPVLIHNGTFTHSNYSKTNSEYSDTFYFAKNLISNPHIINWIIDDSKQFEEYFKDHIGTSRVAILFPNCDTSVITFGSFIQDKGYLFSNVGYKNTNYYNVGGSESYRGGYDDWDYERSDYYQRNILPQNTQTSKAISCSVVNVHKPSADILPTFSIPEGHVGQSYIDNISKIKYIYYMGFWIPMGTKMVPLRVDPTPLNSHHLVYICRKVSDSALRQLVKYQMGDFSNDYRYYDKDLHYIYSHNIDDPVYINHDNLVTDFEIKPKQEYENFYHQYSLLVSSLFNGKNTLKKLSKVLSNPEIIKTTFGKINQDGSIAEGHINSKKDRQVFDREVLELYHFNLIKHIYSSEDERYEKYLKYTFV